MLMTITPTTNNLKGLLGTEDYNKLLADKGNGGEYKLTIQNLDEAIDVYLEIGEDATVSEGYKLFAGNEVEISILRIEKLNLISDITDNTNIRINIT